MAKIIWYENLKASLVILKKKKKTLSIPAFRGQRDEKLLLAETDATDKGEFSIPACLLRWGQGPDWEGVEHRGLAWEHITLFVVLENLESLDTFRSPWIL